VKRCRGRIVQRSTPAGRRGCPVGRLPQVYLYLRPAGFGTMGQSQKIWPLFHHPFPQTDRQAVLSLRAACHDWPRSELQGAVHDGSAMWPPTSGQRGSTGNAL
jgi:hypothetical protein